VKRYFREKGVLFTEINVERDPEAARGLVRKTGQGGLPVIKIGAPGSSASTRSASIRSWPERPLRGRAAYAKGWPT
jgi:glutaredoxin